METVVTVVRSVVAKPVEAFFAVVTYTFLTVCVVMAFVRDAFKPTPSFVPSTKTSQEKKLVEDKNHPKRSSNSPALSFDVFDFVDEQQGLSCEEYFVRVSPHHVAVVHRIYEGDSVSGKTPVICQHGLLQRGGVFVSSGEKSPAFFLARRGMDVWIPNIRCSIKVPGEDPLPEKDARWNWSIRELATEDYPAIIKHVTKMTGRKPVYIGHSQGATEALVASSIDPSASDALAMFIGLAPAFFVKRPNNVAVGKLLCGMPSKLRNLMLGTGCFAPLMCLVQKYAPAGLFATLGGVMFDFLFCWRRNLWPVDRHSAFFRFTPTTVSAQLVKDWMACLIAGGILVNPAESTVFTHSAPKMSCPVGLIWGNDDELVDGALLAKEMERQNPGSVLLARGIPEYSHLDVLWAHDAQETVFEPLATLIETRVHY